MAGVSPPEGIDGTAVSGVFSQASAIEKKNTSFGYADRFDEKYDLVRTLRVGKYKYIRNYQPFNIDALYNFYRYKMLAFKQWDVLYNAGKLNQEQRQFFESKGPEGLYDIDQDPHEVNDLSASPAHQEILMQMREQLREKLAALPDLSFYPEPYLLEHASGNPVAFGQNHQQEIKELMAVADLNLSSFEAVQGKIKQALTDDNPWKRYWGLVVCTSFGKKAKTLVPQIKNLVNQDQENLGRARAMEYLILNQESFDTKIIEELLKKAQSQTEANLILNSLGLIKNLKPQLKFNLSKEIFPPEWYDKPNDLVNRRMDYLIGNR